GREGGTRRHLPPEDVGARGRAARLRAGVRRSHPEARSPTTRAPGAGGSMSTRTPARTPILRALAGAALILGATAAVALWAPAHLEAELAQRVQGVVMGLIVVVFANAAPKTLTPLARLRCDPVAEQAIRRFAGWSLVLGGLGYALAWLAAPLSIANPLGITLLATGGGLALGRCAWARWGYAARTAA